MFWALGLSLFVLPFLREPNTADWDGPDWTRKLDPYPDEEEADDYVLDVPFDEDVAVFDEVAAEEEWELEGTLADWIRDASDARFGRDAAMDADLVDPHRLEAGERVYVAQCAGCHGLEGDGGGPAASHLKPRPRNFRKGLFKFTTTPSGARPTRGDFFRTITRGLSGSAMPPFNLLPEEKRWDAVEYARYLAIKGEFEQLMLDVAWEEEELPDADEVFEIIERRWSAKRARTVFPSAKEPPYDQASIDRGRELYDDTEGAACFACHGSTGRGDGPSAAAFRDGWGYPIVPRDLTTGAFRAGDEGKDLWLTIANGIGGTPMPSYESSFSGEDIWHLVHYVQHLAEVE